MWVEFHIGGEPTSSTITKCVVGDKHLDLHHHPMQKELIDYLLLKTEASSMEALLPRKMVKINMRTDDVQRFLPQAVNLCEHSVATIASHDSPHSELQTIINVLREQQSHMAEQQNVLVELLGSTLNALSPRHEVFKPDHFDGHSQSAEAWLTFFELSCERNRWHSEVEKIDNVYHFLTGAARKWYESRLLGNRESTWASWRESFLSAFGENLADKWSEAIAYSYQNGSVRDYYFEKVQLLRRAEPHLPEESVVALVQIGLPTELRRLTQIRAPTNSEELLRCIRDVGTEQRTLPPLTHQPTFRSQQGHAPHPATSASSRRPFAPCDFRPRSPQPSYPPRAQRTTALAEDGMITQGTQDEQKNE